MARQQDHARMTAYRLQAFRTRTSQPRDEEEEGTGPIAGSEDLEVVAEAQSPKLSL